MKDLRRPGLALGIPGIALLIFVATPAAQTQPFARLNFHVVGPLDGDAGTCIESPLENALTCNAYVVDELPSTGGERYLIYLTVSKIDPEPGLAGVRFGIAYSDNIEVLEWTMCADLEFVGEGENGPWPACGSGNTINWNAAINCQRTMIDESYADAVAGVFEVMTGGGDGVFLVTRNNTRQTPEISIADCQAIVTDQEFMPWPAVGLGDVHGQSTCWLDRRPGKPSWIDTPACGLVPVERTTWGILKGMYR